MPTPSKTQIKLAHKALLTAAVPSHRVFADLARGEAIDADRAPCLVLQIGDVSFDYRDGRSVTVHRAAFSIGIFEAEDADASVADLQEVAIAAIIAAYAADNFNLGGRLEDMTFTGSDSSELNAGDIGGIELAGEMTWQTPPGDFNTIIGQSGLFT